MSTIIRLRGINFNNPALPVVSSFVRRGLKAAFRPAGDLSSMVDLSGNGASLTKRGNPSFTSNALRGDRVNGFKTSISESLNQTLIAVFRTVKNGTEWDGFPLGNYTSTGIDVTQRRGMSVWMSQGAGTDPSKLDLRVATNTHAKLNADGTYINRSSTYVMHNELDPASRTETDWAFAAISVNADTNYRKMYVPRYYPSASYISSDEAASGYSLANRLRADPASGVANCFEIASTPDASTSWGGIIEVAEAIIYDVALTDEELFQQYALSKDFMARVRGITI